MLTQKELDEALILNVPIIYEDEQFDLAKEVIKWYDSRSGKFKVSLLLVKRRKLKDGTITETTVRAPIEKCESAGGPAKILEIINGKDRNHERKENQSFPLAEASPLESVAL